MPGLRRADHELADLAAERPAVGVDDVRGRPDARAVERGRLDRREQVAADDPAGDLRPARVVDDRAAGRRRPRGSTTTSSRDPTARRSSPGRGARRGRGPRTGSVPCGISARTTVGDRPEVGDPVAGDERPQPIRARVVRRALVQDEPGAEQERAGDRPRAHHPAEVGEPEEGVAARAGRTCGRGPGRALIGKPPWTWTAPFGLPVVPDV